MLANSATLCLGCLARTPGASFGQRLRAHRLAAGLTQEQLAGRAGLNTGTVWAYEQDERRPRDHSLAKLVAVLGPALTAGPPDETAARPAQAESLSPS